METMQAKDTATEALSFFDPFWPVIYEDNHLLAVYKPSGLLVQGDRTRDINLLDLGKRWLKERYHKPGKVFLALVHRLDRPVAGVVLFARTSKAASRLARQFRERTVEKHYLAVVRGSVAGGSGRLCDHIERIDRISRIVQSPTHNSQEARLGYTVLGTHSEKSLLQIELETGRRHQIRIQLADMGHPIIGDLRYGPGPPLPDRQIALLAHALKVTHPIRGDRLVFTSPIPHRWPWPNLNRPEKNRLPWDWRVFASIFGTAGS